MILKIGFYIIAIMAFIYACSWTFNHINPWVAIIGGFLGGLFFINHIVTIIKEQINNNNENN